MLDLAFGLVAGVAILIVTEILHRAGLYKKPSEGGPRLNWLLFVVVFVVVSFLNVVWPT